MPLTLVSFLNRHRPYVLADVPVDPGTDLPQDLLAAIHAYVRTLPIYDELAAAGDLRTSIARRGDQGEVVTPYAVLTEESSSPSIYPTGYECHRVNLKLVTYDPSMDKANDLGRRLAKAVASSSYRWVGGSSSKPVSPSYVNARELMPAPGGEMDLYSLTARMMVHTVRPIDG